MLALAIGYTVYGTATKEKVELVAVGSEAPDFTLVDLNGEKHKLSDYKGQGVFLNFWELGVSLARRKCLRWTISIKNLKIMVYKH